MAKAKKSWYAVRKGRRPGLYTSWDACKAQVDRYRGAKFMGFVSREEAVDWLGDAAVESGSDYSTSPGPAAPAQASPSTSQFAGLLTPLATPVRRSINGLSSVPPSSSSPILSLRVNHSPGGSAFYAVARGRRPGIYPTWPQCRAQVDGFSGARYKKFTTLTEATEFVAVYGGGGHFSQFTCHAFEPDDEASFGEEWARLSQSQGWVRGTKNYMEQRASALRNELQTHFFASPSRALPAIKSEESEGEDADPKPLVESDRQLHEAAVMLQGFQLMCEAVGKSPGDTVEECQGILKQKLVNIVDLIDYRRTGGRTAVRIWTDFEAFKKYTLNSSGGDKTIPLGLAKRDPFLKCFLQNFSRPGGHCGGAIGYGGAVVKKRARCEDDQDYGDFGHQNKRIMCS